MAQKTNNKEDETMTDFIFAYHGGEQPESAEAGAVLMARWQA